LPEGFLAADLDIIRADPTLAVATFGTKAVLAVVAGTVWRGSSDIRPASQGGTF
jgi:hypothetical protein